MSDARCCTITRASTVFTQERTSIRGRKPHRAHRGYAWVSGCFLSLDSDPQIPRSDDSRRCYDLATQDAAGSG